MDAAASGNRAASRNGDDRRAAAPTCTSRSTNPSIAPATTIVVDVARPARKVTRLITLESALGAQATVAGDERRARDRALPRGRRDRRAARRCGVRSRRRDRMEQRRRLRSTRRDVRSYVPLALGAHATLRPAKRPTFRLRDASPATARRSCASAAVRRRAARSSIRRPALLAIGVAGTQTSAPVGGNVAPVGRLDRRSRAGAGLRASHAAAAGRFARRGRDAGGVVERARERPAERSPSKCPRKADAIRFRCSISATTAA